MNDVTKYLTIIFLDYFLVLTLYTATNLITRLQTEA